ncbi:hypothetical protein HS125_16705 [bacterium]|nr:hypothetical protein [bacterium]
MYKALFLTTALVLAGVAEAHNVYAEAPHVSTGIEIGGKQVTLTYQSIELGQGRSFGRLTAGETQKNATAYQRILSRLKQVGELETGVALVFGDKRVEPGKYYMGFHCDETGAYSIIVSTADEKMTEVARQPLPLADTPDKAPFLSQVLGRAMEKSEIAYSVHFGDKKGGATLKLAP